MTKDDRSTAWYIIDDAQGLAKYIALPIKQGKQGTEAVRPDDRKPPKRPRP